MEYFLVVEMCSDESCEAKVRTMTKFYGVASVVAKQLAKQAFDELEKAQGNADYLSLHEFKNGKGFYVSSGSSYTIEFQILKVDYQEKLNMDTYYSECIEEVERNYGIHLTNEQKRRVVEELDNDEELNETLWFKTFDKIEEVYGKEF